MGNFTLKWPFYNMGLMCCWKKSLNCLCATENFEIEFTIHGAYKQNLIELNCVVVIKIAVFNTF